MGWAGKQWITSRGPISSYVYDTTDRWKRFVLQMWYSKGTNSPNASNMCIICLGTGIDITEGLQKHVIIMYCPERDSPFQPTTTRIKAQLESKKLLTFCVKVLKNLNTVRLVNAEFVWTEPHWKRINVKLKVQKEELNGAILEQSYVVEYVQQDHMCESCSRVQANPDQRVAAVQLRQHVAHR